VVEEVWIPSFQKKSGVVYLRHATRAGFDPAIVGVAVVLVLDGKDGVCEDARIVLGGVGPTPLRIHRVEDILKGEAVDESLIRKVAMEASEGIDPIQDVRASADYRRQMVTVYLERGILKALRGRKEGRSVKRELKLRVNGEDYTL
jgi:carbon-monoxide dehydrogenase medium subunit